MEEKLLINGGTKLQGCVRVDGSKNAYLPILAACVLCEGEVLLDNYVNLSDINCMREILKVLEIDTSLDGEQLYVNAKNSKNKKISHELTQKVRASIFILGALLGKFRSAVVSYPGGCNIGARPIDIFIKGFRAFGVKVVERHGYIYCHGENMKPADILMDFPSVGATESFMMCACLLDGETTIRNCAKEPEIVDLQNFLNSMGAKISGAGTDTIKIVGVKNLRSTEYRVMPDRIVAGTYLLATATCGGDVLVENAVFAHNESLISFLRQTACKISVKGDRIRLRANKRPLSIQSLETNPFPLFPTDLQPQMMVLQSVSNGTSVITENLFENRFGHIPELRKMGAEITFRCKTAVVNGVERLYGADVSATDLRAGAALVIAGMKAEGYTTVSRIDFIDRGYDEIEKKYQLLGADIKRIKIE